MENEFFTDCQGKDWAIGVGRDVLLSIAPVRNRSLSTDGLMLMGKMAVKLVQISLILLAAAAVVYRGNTYTDPNGMSMLPVVMCGLLATFLMLAAVGVLFQERADGFEIE